MYFRTYGIEINTYRKSLLKHSEQHPEKSGRSWRLCDRALQMCEPRFLPGKLEHMDIALLRSNGY